MWPVAETQVAVGRAQDVEAVGFEERTLVAIARAVPEHDFVAGLDCDAVELDVPEGGASEVHERRRPPLQLLHGAVDAPVEVLAQ